MDTISEIIGSVPQISSWAFISLCLVSFFTFLISAIFGLGGGAMLVAIMASLLNPLAVIPIRAVIQMNSNLCGCCHLLLALPLAFQLEAK